MGTPYDWVLLGVFLLSDLSVLLQQFFNYSSDFPTCHLVLTVVFAPKSAVVN